jgi:hypothetical protein
LTFELDSPTGRLLLTIAGDGADDGIFLASHTVHGTLSVSFSTSSIVFSLAGGVLLLTGLLPVLRTGKIADLPENSKSEWNMKEMEKRLTVSTAVPFIEWYWPVDLLGPSEDITIIEERRWD